MEKNKTCIKVVGVIFIVGIILTCFILITYNDKPEDYTNWEYWTYCNGMFYRAHDIGDSENYIWFSLDAVKPENMTGQHVVTFEEPYDLWIPVPVRNDFPVWINPEHMKEGSTSLTLNMPDVEWEEEYTAIYHMDGTETPINNTHEEYEVFINITSLEGDDWFTFTTYQKPYTLDIILFVALVFFISLFIYWLFKRKGKNGKK